MTISDVRLNLTHKEGAVKAFGSLSLDNTFAVRGMRVMQDKNGKNFVSMPSRQKSDGTYEDVCFPLNKEFYKEIHHRVMQKAAEFSGGRPVLAEGIAFLPSLMKADGIRPEQYLCVVSAPEFQVRHYLERSWTDLFLADCTDREKAFSSWMEREAGFADAVKAQADQWNCGIISVETDADAEALPDAAEKYFGLETLYHRPKGAEGLL